MFLHYYCVLFSFLIKVLFLLIINMEEDIEISELFVLGTTPNYLTLSTLEQPNYSTFHIIFHHQNYSWCFIFTPMYKMMLFGNLI